MVVLGFSIVVGVPFLVGGAAMGLPISRVGKVGIALTPVVLFALATAGGVFWIGDIGAPTLALCAMWGWFMGILLSPTILALGQAARRLARALT